MRPFAIVPYGTTSLRLPPGQAHGAHETSDHSPSFTPALKGRLACIRRTDYHALVDAYASDLVTLQPHRHATTRQAAQGVDARKAQAAAVRARTGALRSAADVLVGGPPVPPSLAVRDMIRAQFITAPRTERQATQLRDAMTAARALPAKKEMRAAPPERSKPAGQVKSRSRSRPQRLEELAHRLRLCTPRRPPCPSSMGHPLGPGRHSAMGGRDLVRCSRQTFLEDTGAAYSPTHHVHGGPCQIRLRHRGHSSKGAN